MARDHRKLKAFELADRLVVAVYRESRRFPPDEKFSLTSQLRRLAIAVPEQIVKACACESQEDYLSVLQDALISLRGVGYLIELSNKLEFLEEKRMAGLLELHDDAGKVLAGLIRSISK